jgi:hypothetical protein
MPSNDWGIDDEHFFGGTPDDDLPPDTVCCVCCGAPFHLSDNDGVLVEVPQGEEPCFICGGSGGGPDDAEQWLTCANCDGKGTRPCVAQLYLCSICAEATHKAYLAACDRAGLCAHGEDDDGECEECLQEYEALRKQYGKERP